ncbi:dTDP-4-amino-4 [Sporomusaceae bacterium BoRhaA]|uniref:DegT/DnrJ/EryC1/StrS family aminotransferase n=1 Tax=Pelorhabdus rhamnosifermentans TaxID=2772457 RepID=UPI001C060401|nr:DegT/DnrJ/EryC1/StrS family aminotransferase [Pelorhabdus rhamnosifermentans]MBU2699065.1 dTDP-4-amino-4 [Pelorhabdus rhamnosifermentans]
MGSAKIYLSSPHMSDEGYEKVYVREAFDTNWIAPLGKNVNEFEKEFSAKLGAKCAAALSSGTAAIHMALKAVGVGQDQERIDRHNRDIVFCPSMTFSATANPIIYQNAVPVFIDSDEESWNMSPVALEKAFQKYEGKVKAVLVAHLYGLSADLDKILALCNHYHVPLIEDAAESLGTLYKGKYTGTFGKYGIFSFNGNKIITTSGGGMVVANDPETSEERIAKIRFWATQSRDTARWYQHSELGYNYRMSNVVAGIGRGQLKVLDQRIAEKKNIFAFYQRAFEGLDGIEMMPVNDWNQPNYWLSCITLNGSVTPLDVLRALDEENIESRPIWKPMHLQPYYSECDFISQCESDPVDGELFKNSVCNSVSEKIFKQGVCLPSDTNMNEDDLERVVRIMKKLWR